MRETRVKLIDRDGLYHCMSRVVNNHFLFIEGSTKSSLIQLLKKVTKFCGVKLLNYAIMDNHYHVLIKVPKRPKKELTDKELFKKIETFYGKKHYNTLEAQFKLFSEVEESESFLLQKEEFKDGYFKRMYDLSECMKMFNHHSANWCEKHLEWEGKVWRDRFKSTLIQDIPYLKMLVSAYIDLNAVRANIVTDPKDYLYCGYREALLEDGEIRKSLQEIFGKDSWAECQEEYRVFLAQRMKAKFKPNQTPEDRERVKRFAKQVEEEGGELTMADYLKMYSKQILNARVLGDRSFMETIKQAVVGIGRSKLRRSRQVAIVFDVEGNREHNDTLTHGSVELN